MFRVPWLDDRGEVQVNRGFRIEMNSAIGPYKGGLRFHPSVNLGILKFLAFEQVFKNSLTTLPMGGGKGGSDFDPKGKSDDEVMRFCQSFMTELWRHIGPTPTCPAGDIGVGGREIGYLFGQYKRLRERVHRRAHRQGPQLGRLADPSGSHRLRLRLLRRRDAARPAARRSRARSAWCRAAATSRSTRSRSCSTSAPSRSRFRTRTACIHRPGGHRPREAGVGDRPQERAPRPHQGVRGRVSRPRRYVPSNPMSDSNPLWDVKARLRVPERDAERDQRARTRRTWSRTASTVVAEGANMPSTLEATKVFLDAGILYGPAKAANAGGVATSGLEMSQNSMRLSWTREEVDDRLHKIMIAIHKNAYGDRREVRHARQSGRTARTSPASSRSQTR